MAKEGVAKSIRRAASAVIAAVRRDPGVVSWWALHPQLQWAIDDLIVYVSKRTNRVDLANLRRAMEDGEPYYWQRFWMLGGGQQVEAIKVAMRKAAKRGAK